MRLVRASRGLFDHAVDADGKPITAYEFIRDYLPLAQGHALLHAAAILEGQVMIWPNPKLSRRGRWWLKVQRLWRRRN
jgi:hypothetical protein